MNSRRGFFKTLVAGALAAVLPKPKLPAILIKRIPDPLPLYPPFDFESNLERANRHIAQIEAEWLKDVEFWDGDQWPQRIIDQTSENSFPARG